MVARKLVAELPTPLTPAPLSSLRATSRQRMNQHRIVLGVAALYNVAFGIWAGFFPNAFFDWFRLEPPRYPSIWSCLGMVIGLFGIGYGYAAWQPSRGQLFVGIGLAGKVLGPIGWLWAVKSAELPPRTFPLILANDLVWWFPFLSYLLHQVPIRRRIVSWICTVLHVVACMGLLAVQGGTEMQPDMSARLDWITARPEVWVAAWVTWSLASMSLLALLMAWSERLVEAGVSRTVTRACCATCAIGLLNDLAGEAVNICWLTWPNLTVAAFARGARIYAYLGAGIANGLYCFAGIVLSAVAWRVRQLRGWLGLLGFVMWKTSLTLRVSVTFVDISLEILTRSVSEVFHRAKLVGSLFWTIRSQFC
jgi:hypothetical protein